MEAEADEMSEPEDETGARKHVFWTRCNLHGSDLNSSCSYLRPEQDLAGQRSTLHGGGANEATPLLKDDWQLMAVARKSIRI